MWEYTTPSHGLPIGAFFRGESARNAYRRNEDYSITKGSSTVVTCCADPLDDAVGLLPNDLDLLLASHFSGLTTETQASRYIAARRGRREGKGLSELVLAEEV